MARAVALLDGLQGQTPPGPGETEARVVVEDGSTASPERDSHSQEIARCVGRWRGADPVQEAGRDRVLGTQSQEVRGRGRRGKTDSRPRVR